MADETPEKLDVYSKGGELFTFIGGQVFQLNPTASSMALMKKLALEKGDDWDAVPEPPKRHSATTPAAPAAVLKEAQDPDLLAKRRATLAALKEADEASERFDDNGVLRGSFDVEPHERPGSENYERGRDRYLHQLGRSL